jgi:carbamoyl-phosphate synthase large subunit
VLRSLRERRPSRGVSPDRLVGLAYDALDPGVYAGDVVPDVFLLPYPSSSVEPFLDRLEYVHHTSPIDVLIPTLDAELPAFISLAPRLGAMGIATFLPSREQFDLRSKARLAGLGMRASIEVPKTVVVTSAQELARVHDQVPYPFFVKGVFYGATYVTCLDEAVAAFHKAAAQWGVPVIVQAGVSGEEMNVIGLGDGEGGLFGAVAMKKLVLTDKGKGWAGITIRDEKLIDVAERFVRATKWRGGFEAEVIRTKDGRYELLEINPRFPAWVYLATAAGVNLPAALVDMALGKKPKPVRDYEVGKLFVRIALDQIASVRDLEQIVTAGEIRRALPPIASTAA